MRIYRIAESVGGRKHWRIDGQLPKFSPSNLRNLQHPYFYWYLVHVIQVGQHGDDGLC